MSDRRKRTIRTVIQIVLGIASVIPDVVAKVPLGATGVQLVAVSAAVTHYFHLIERIPGFPESLKVD